MEASIFCLTNVVEISFFYPLKFGWHIDIGVLVVFNRFNTFYAKFDIKKNHKTALVISCLDRFGALLRRRQ